MNLFAGLVSVRGNGEGTVRGNRALYGYKYVNKSSKTSQEKITVHPVAHMVTQTGGPGRNTVLEQSKIRSEGQQRTCAEECEATRVKHVQKSHLFVSCLLVHIFFYTKN